MSDYSSNYTVAKKSKIIIAANNIFVTFKPFIESYSLDSTNNFIEVKSVDNITQKTTGTKERKYKISFNVPAVSVNEAIANHKKFHKLLRMSMPEDQSRDNSFFIKFANLIHKESPASYSISDGKNSSSFTNFSTKIGLQCKISSLNYQPDLDLGFFDNNGMFFAKNYKIDLDLEVYPGSYPVGKKYSADEIAGKKPDTTAEGEEAAAVSKKKVTKINPGNLFGFPVKYN